MRTVPAAFLVAVLGSPLALAQSDAAAGEPSYRAKMTEQAEGLLSFVESDLGASFLGAIRDLPAIEPRTVYRNRATGAALSEAEAREAGEAALEGFEPSVFDERRYYEVFFGTPVAYTRAIDVAGQFGLASVDGRRVFDFGYGGIGHLRALASLGADVVGVEVQDVLRALYAPDHGPVPRCRAAGEGEPGAIELLHGRFPAEDELVRAAGGDFALFLTKNVLKRGYIHPEREANPAQLIDLGVDDETYVRAVFDMLAPGGLMVIYNLYPAQAAPDEPYIPWATGGCPFERELLEEVGFEVLALDQDDTRAVHEMAFAFGWNESMDLENDLFAMFTVLRRPAEDAR